MATTRATTPLHVSRGLFRLLKTPYLSEQLLTKYNAKQATTAKVAAVSNKQISNSTTAFLMNQYRKHQSLAGSDAEAQRKLALDTYRLRRDLAEREFLHSMDTGAEEVLTPKEMSRRAAARAGLYMPESYEKTE
jgi:hypothetical protein